MIIDLTDPLTIAIFTGLLIGLIILVITGVIKFSVIAYNKKILEEDFLRLRIALESLQKEHQEEIENINKSHKVEKIKAIEQALDIYDKKFTAILNEYKQIEHLPPHGGVNWLRELYFYGKSSKTKKNS